MASVSVALFDAYGTLFDLTSAVRPHAPRIGEHWEAFARTWRLKQAEYTWVRSLAGSAHHHDFGRLVDDALGYAAAIHGVTDTSLLATLRGAFDALDIFPDVQPGLGALRGAGLPCAILTNGTPAAMGRLIRHAKLDGVFQDVLSIEAVGVYKPDPRVYHLAVDRFDVPGERIAFVSSNPWDVFGAHAFGLRVFWLNRAGEADEYGLRGQVTEIADLSELAPLLL